MPAGVGTQAAPFPRPAPQPVRNDQVFVSRVPLADAISTDAVYVVLGASGETGTRKKGARRHVRRDPRVQARLDLTDRHGAASGAKRGGNQAQRLLGRPRAGGQDV